MRTVALIGVPGSGKTTVMRGVLERFPAGFNHKLIFGKKSAEHHYLVGIYRGLDFDGTDQLSFQAASSFKAWAKELPQEAVVVFEGDRLANAKVFEFCLQHGALQVVLIDAAPEHIARRLASRAKKTGKAQDATWLAGRQSKVSRLAGKYFGRVLRWENNTQKELEANIRKLDALLFSTTEVV